MQASNTFSLMGWLRDLKKNEVIIIDVYQRFYLWDAGKVLTMLFCALMSLLGITQEKYPLGGITISISKTTNGDGNTYIVNAITDGQQRLYTLLLVHKAMADIALLFDRMDIYISIMSTICLNFKVDAKKVPVITTKNQLDAEDISTIFNFVPTKSDLYITNIKKFVGRVGNIDVQSPFLINYHQILIKMIDYLDNGDNGNKVTLDDLYDAIQSLQFTVSVEPSTISPSESFNNRNVNVVPMDQYTLLVSFFANEVSAETLGKYTQGINNSRIFRKKRNEFVKHIMTHVVGKSGGSKSYETIKKYVVNDCTEREDERYGSYEMHCKTIFETYGNAYVAFLEEDETFIPKDILERVRLLKLITTNLWENVAMGAVKLMIADRKSNFCNCSEDTLNVIRKMFDTFLCYTSLKYFTKVNKQSLGLLICRFFFQHKFTDYNIVRDFKEFLASIEGNGEMPSNLDDIVSFMITPAKDKSTPIYRGILAMIDIYANKDSDDISYTTYNTLEHIASSNMKKTEHYNIDAEHRTCFANCSILTLKENNDADVDVLQEKRRVVYDSHKLAVVNASHVRDGVDKNIAPSNFDDWNMDSMKKRAYALASTLLQMKDECFSV